MPSDNWTDSLDAEDAKFWRQQEIHKLNPTGEMNITPIIHTNEGEATNWVMNVDLLTVKHQQAVRVQKLIRRLVDLIIVLAALGAISFLTSAILKATGGN